MQTGVTKVGYVNPKLSGWLDSVLNAVPAGIGVASQLFGGGGQQGAGAPAKGDAAIKAFVDRVIAGLNQIKAATNQLPREQAVSGAQALAATLSDSTQVYQAKSGSDAAILRDGKARAAALVAEIEAAYNIQPIVTAGTVTTAGSTAAAPATGVTGSVINNVLQNKDLLLVVGGGFAAVALVLWAKK